MLNSIHDPDHFISELYERYYSLLKNYCVILFHYDSSLNTLAEDCVQDAFYTALTHPEDIMQSPNPYAWLAKCCKNNCQAYLCGKTQTPQLLNQASPLKAGTVVPDAADSISRCLNRHQASAQLEELQNGLTPLEKAIFDDYYISALTIAETAAHNDIAPYIVKASLDRIRSKAKDIFKEENH